MALRSRAVRTVGQLVAALQLLLPGAAAWADARLDAADAHAPVHVESHTSDSCARIHAPDCALCHFLTTPATFGRPTALRREDSGTTVAPAAEAVPPRHPLARPHPQPRAPPQLS